MWRTPPTPPFSPGSTPREQQEGYPLGYSYTESAIKLKCARVLGVFQNRNEDCQAFDRY